MHTQQGKGRTVAAVGSITAAIGARRALLDARIPAEVVSLLPHETKKGCAYGVEFAVGDEVAARAALRAARVGVSQYLRKEGN